MEKLITFLCNNELVSFRINPAATLLDFLRNQKKLTGTKEGCREGDCGACTVIIGTLTKGKVKYKTVNSCLLPVAVLEGKHVVTIEGLSGSVLNYIQEQFIDEGATQCGFCTPGFIVSLTNYFMNHIRYSADDAISALDGNICRCTGYAGIKRAINNIINFLEKDNSNKNSAINFLVKKNILPAYFTEASKRLMILAKKIDPSKNGKAIGKNVISGGTDLYVQKWETLLEEEDSFVSEISGLKVISKDRNKIFIGATVTIEEFSQSQVVQKHFPFLTGKLKLFGSLPIRNRATIAGNIVNASPIGDMTNILIALNAVVHLRYKNSRKNIPIKDFYLDYKTLRKKKNDIVEKISITIPPQNSLFNFEKISRRTYLDIASVNSSAIMLVYKGEIKLISISAGGVAPIPLYLRSTSEFLLDKKINRETIDKAVQIAKLEISPISDARGSKEYKTLLLAQLIKAHFIKLFPEIDLDEVIK